MDLSDVMPVTDADGHDLRFGDRVKVTGSDRFGEGEGSVIGYVRQLAEDVRAGADPLRHESIRIRVLMDNGTDGEDYTASQGRVSFTGAPVEPLQPQ